MSVRSARGAATWWKRDQVLNFTGTIDGKITQGRQHAAIADPEYRDSKSIIRYIKEGAGSIGRHSRGRVHLRGGAEFPGVHQAAIRINLKSVDTVGELIALEEQGIVRAI